MAYRIEYTQDAVDDLRSIGRDRTAVIGAIERRLTDEPARPDRNRFEADPNPFGHYELRAQPYRVYYDIREDEQVVLVQAVLFKPRETAYRRGRRVDTRE